MVQTPNFKKKYISHPLNKLSDEKIGRSINTFKDRLKIDLIVDQVKRIPYQPE